MNGSAPERLIRYLDYPSYADDPAIYNEALGGFVRPDWLAISHAMESGTLPETFVLYFLSTDGEVIEFIQRDSVEIALDEALSLTGLPHDCWVACDVPLDEATSLRRSVITDATESS